jgi:hypothetical protein
MQASETLAREQTGFQLERFQWTAPDRLELEGRWYGVRGRRFVRPVLTVEVRGRRRRLLALLEHKPWPADEGAPWIAAFPWEGAHEGTGSAELEVGSLTVDLPPPGGRFARAAEEAPPAAEAPQPEAAEPAAPEPAAPEEPAEVREALGASRATLERDLAGARAELRRLQQRHEAREHELRAELRRVTERLEAAEAASRDAGDEARALREELEAGRAAHAAELEQLRASEAAGQAAALAKDQVAAEAEQLREAARRATADNERLKQTARRATAEAERLRAAVRRPAEPAVAPAPAPPADAPSRDPQTTVPFEALPAVAAARKELATERAARERLATQVERLRRELAAARDVQRPPVAPPAEPAQRAIPAPQPGTRVTKRIGAARTDPPPPSGRLLGELPSRPLSGRSGLSVWGPRLVALVLVALLLGALVLILSGVL